MAIRASTPAPSTSGTNVCFQSVWFILGIASLMLAMSPPAQAHRSDHPGILLLYLQQKDAPYAQMIRAEVVKVLDDRLSTQYNLFSDSVEGWSGAEGENDQALLRLLKQRYSRLNIHLLIPVGNKAVDFARLHGREMVPEASVVYMAETFGGQSENPPMLDATGVILRFDPEASLQLALQQNPGTKRVVVVAGSSAQERAELLAARNEFRRYEDSVEFQYTTDLTLAELLARLSRLPRDEVVMVLNFTQDSAGDEFVPARILPVISKAATRPIYAVYGSLVGAGAVGGRVHDFTRIGHALGVLAVQVLKGARAGDLPVEEGTFQEAMFDWRQMQRFGIKEKQLPPGAIVLNRELTAWDRYRWWILAGIALVCTQSTLIGFLIFIQIRRARAERELAADAELEGLISELAVSFINISTGLVGEQIEHSCNRLLRFFHVDRVAIYGFSPAKDLITLLYSYRRAGIEPFRAAAKCEEIPWMAGRVLAGKPALISRFEDAPAGAAKDLEYMERQSIRSIAAIPLQTGQGVSGILVLTAVRQEVEWTHRIADRLQTISRVFAYALDKQRAEEALRSSEDLKARILDSLISHLAVISGSGKVISVNKGWKEFWSANGGTGEPGMGIGVNYLEICRRASRMGCRDADRALAGILSVLEGTVDSFEMEYDCSSPGEKRWYLMVVTPLLHGEGAVIRHRDVTFRNQALGMLRESEERFRAVADSAPVMIWMAGPDRMCNYFNKGWLDFRGRSIAQEWGEGWKTGIHPDDAARCMQVYNEAFDFQRPFTMEYRLRRADDEFRWVIESGVPRSLMGGTFAGFIGACVDITDQKESAQARVQLSGLLINAQEQERASIARELHDHINQRLALLAIEIQQFESSARSLSKQEETELEHLWDLTNEISHDVQALSHQLHSSQLQHLGLVAGIRSLCQEFSKSSGVEAEFECTGAVPRIDENVSLALFRVTQEALRNTAKYGRANLVQSDLHYDHSVLTLRVNDDGVGFDPMSVNGGGLGLISMRERMRLVGGELLIHSKPGGGTQIEARIPLVHETTERSVRDLPARVERRRHIRV